jgi:single-strand DNA-binding protein
MFQKIIIVGNLGRDPEMRYLPDGTAVTNFSVATSRSWTGKDGQPHEETTWFRVNVWGRQAETANQYLSKGRRVLVEGQLQGDPQTGAPKLFTRSDGTVSASFEVRADSFRFLSSKGEGGHEGGEEGSYAGDGAAHEEDDIPF